MKENTIDKIISYFEDNDDIFIACIEELDSYDGYLNDDRYYNMEDLPELFGNDDPMNLLYRAYYGHDADTWHTDAHGQKEYGQFNPNRDYFTLNGYGNFVSTDWKDYTAHLDRYAVEAMQENRAYIDSIDSDDELAALFDELEEDWT